MSEPILSVRGLSKTITLHILGGKTVRPLRDVSFELFPGECLGIVGPSGAGKSSLLKVIHRTYLADSGEVLFRERTGAVTDLLRAPEREIARLRREEMHYTSQFLKAPPRVPAVDVVANVLIRRGVPQDEARARAAKTLGGLGIGEDLQTSYPVLFSGGEQQRVNVARALVDPPRLLLLDEPTSALDTENGARVVEQLLEARRNGTAMIGIFHDLNVLRALANRALVLEDGMVAQYGDIEDIELADALQPAAPIA